MSQTLLKRALHDMYVIRRFEERAGVLYGMKKISGFCHLYNGQEAVVIGIQYAKDSRDQTITGYRDHGHIIAAGVLPKYVMAELFGRAQGSSKGKGGSMHLFAKDKNFYGGHGIVGAPVPIGTGIAFANQYQGNKAVAICSFGDGAANQGQVYESFNMAALWKLPVLYIVENNQYAMGTSVFRSTAQRNFSKRGEGLGIKGKQVNGMDVEDVYRETKKALAYVRKHGPYILEMKTYRYSGHSMSDPAKYRSRQEVQTIRERKDPIKILQARLMKKNILNDAQLQRMNKKIITQIDEAVDFAERAPWPQEDALLNDIYVSSPKPRSPKKPTGRKKKPASRKKPATRKKPKPKGKTRAR